ncbi:MAG: hypothetical protein SNH13_06515, partial [Rikenellaceae bacterium]
MMQLISFDVFDTLLIRRCGAAENIFYLTAQRLFAQDQSRADSFVLWRLRAEGDALVEEPSIEDIYSSFESEYFGVSSQRALAAEKSVEWENLTANTSLKECVKRCRREGAEICYISDMYLDEAFLRMVLSREGIIDEGEKIYVSSQYKATKASGKLYDVVRCELSPTAWTHYGDNSHSDIKMARRRGIKARYVDSRFTQEERYLMERFRPLRRGYIYSSIVGAMRSVRLLLGGGSAAEIASGYVAPIYIAYVRYILDSAARDGVDELYFLNRDSYILHQIAERLNRYDNLKLKYLFISRRSLFLPALEGMQRGDVLELFDGKTLIGKDIESIFKLFQLDQRTLNAHGIKLPYGRVSSSLQQREILDIIFNSAVTPLVQEQALQQRALLLKYLEQQGVTSSQRAAFVDVGWLGTSRLMVNRVLRRGGFKPVEFFYFGVRPDVLPYSYGAFNSFINGATRGLTAIIENYFSVAPYRSALSYKQDKSGRVRATFKDDHRSARNTVVECNIRASLNLIDSVERLGVDYPQAI